MIQLKIEKETDLYNRYAPEKDRINPEVFQYLTSYCTISEYKNHIHDTIQIFCNEPIDEEKLKQTIINDAKKKQDDFDCQIRINQKRALQELIFGIILSIVGVALAIYLDKVLLAIISLFGSMSIREAITILKKVNPDIKRLKKQLEPLCDFELEVINNEN